MKYCTLDDVKTLVPVEVEEAFEGQVEKWIEQQTRNIETLTQRVFIADEDFSVRVYDGRGGRELLVDEFVELNEVKIDDRVVEVFTYPANVLPKFKLWVENGINRGKQNVSVSAKWGYSEAVPEDIRFACAVLVAGIIHGQHKTEGDILKEKIGNYDVTYRENEVGLFTQAKDILNMYRKITI